MNTERYFPALGRLTILEVFAYYDEPVLYAAKNERDHLFLVVLAEDPPEQSRWLCAPISSGRYQQVRTGAICLYTAFKAPEGGYVLDIGLSKEPSGNDSCDWLQASQIGDHLLPEAGEALALEAIDEVASPPDVTTMAHQLRKEVLSLRFQFEDTSKMEAPAGLLGQLLSSFQQLVRAVGQSVHAQGTTRGALPREIVDKMSLAVTGVFPGSFGVVLEARESANLFGESPATKTLAQVLKVVQSTGDQDEMIGLLSQMKGRTAQKYRQFLSRLTCGVDNVDLDWGSPTANSSISASVSSGVASSAVAAIAGSALAEQLSYSIVGRLVGVNIRLRTYELWDLAEGQKYSGKILDEALPYAEHATVNEVYLATIKEETVVDATGEESVRHRLAVLESADETKDSP